LQLPHPICYEAIMDTPNLDFSRATRRQALWQSLFSCSTLSAAGAVALSMGTGSIIGAAGFAVAAFSGVAFKYASLRGHDLTQEGNAITRFVCAPTITAKMLTASAAINALSNLGHLAISVVQGAPTQDVVSYTLKSLAWICGTAGDLAMVRMDKANFEQASQRHTQQVQPASKLRQTFMRLVHDPGFFYNSANVFFCIMLAGGAQQGQAIPAIIGGACFAFGAFSNLVGKGNPQIRSAVFGAIGTALMGAAALNAGQHSMALAQAFFLANWARMPFEQKAAEQAKKANIQPKKLENA
jgi:hypothetical protein